MTTDPQHQTQFPVTFPLEIIGTILSFCTGKTISTFLVTAVASIEQRPKLLFIITSLIKQRLLHFSEYLDRTPNYMPCLMSPYVKDYVLKQEENYEYMSTNTVRSLSTRLAVLDYLEEPKLTRGIAYEWPVWCGIISLTYQKDESSSTVHSSESDQVTCQVHVVIHSPCWYPALVDKWKRGMAQCHAFRSDISRHYTGPPTHVARMTPVSAIDAQHIQTFLQYMRQGDDANPVDGDQFQDLVFNQLFLTSPHEAYMKDPTYLSLNSGNVKAFLHGARTCGDDLLFAFWTDMTSTDRMRSCGDFSNDILQLQRNRAHLDKKSGALKKGGG